MPNKDNARKPPSSKSSRGDVRSEKPADITSPGFTSIYSNSVSFVTTVWDLRLVFGEVRPGTGPDEGMVNERKVSVVMSHSHAKALLDILGSQIARIEQDFGEIAYKSPGSEGQD